MPEAFFCSEMSRARYMTLFQEAQLLTKQMHWAGEALSNWTFDNEALVPLSQKISSPPAQSRNKKKFFSRECQPLRFMRNARVFN